MSIMAEGKAMAKSNFSLDVDFLYDLGNIILSQLTNLDKKIVKEKH